ncbi:MAG: glycosyltransferase family 4 protein [Acidimicrobiaceae bacterium]|nr:glycosyltransferase family 4 protein [Acidimicrobiaceae bacterium]MXW74790.1 glycosyltransferase family 4 protein [Acidimicrobiaceae bacterium]MYA73425.1 glycosyltransferase family 4 protein [Acidimicrobiaceae bacterium]MYC42017.1 glycosyltransferase family 4 protein [Acidimicrobiaceae bacterium]MYD08021.1 glycosyltransferase family 4 protein [Acidimicrobiaceae bacterium]
MRIQIVCPHFEPDVAPTGVVISEVVRGLVSGGHEVDVVTSLPWYLDHAVDEAWKGRIIRKERTPWGSITRVYPFPTNKRKILARAFGFAGFTALAWVCSLTKRRRPEVIMVMSPPLTLGLAAWLTARLRRAPFVFNVQDVFPDVAVEVGAISNKRVIRLLEGLERFVYRRADAVTVLSEDLRGNVESKIAGETTDDRGVDKVRLIPNFVDTERIRPQARDNAYRSEFGLGTRTVVMYAGNLGFSQPLELMVEAARELADRDDVVFVVNGDGSRRQELQLLAGGLDNLVFADYQPAERLGEVLAAGDVHVIALRRGLGRSSVPSKLYSILAAGRAVLASVDSGTEVATVVSSQRAGVVVAPQDQAAFTAAVLELVDKADLAAMGSAGREFVLQWASPEGVAAAYADLFAELRHARRGKIRW